MSRLRDKQVEGSMDLIFLGVLFGFFALTAGLVRLCEKV